jgi:Lrp/AsnC family transcriptional regulator for asnA, asnC and gidA
MKTDLIENADDLDLQIINLLQEDCRLSFSKIASKLGISAGTVFNHVKNLEKKGVLKSYAAIVDLAKLGYSLTAITLIQVEGGHLKDVENEIVKAANILAAYETIGDYTIVVITKFKDGADLKAFTKNLVAVPFIRGTVTNVAFNVIKEDLRIKL